MNRIFLDLFSYESVEYNPPPSNSVFRDCTILKAFGAFSPGDKVQYIGVEINLHLWTTEDDFEEEHIIL